MHIIFAPKAIENLNEVLVVKVEAEVVICWSLHLQPGNSNPEVGVYSPGGNPSGAIHRTFLKPQALVRIIS